MNEASKYICNWVSKAIETHWDNINTDLCCIEETKEEFTEKVKVDLQDAVWFLQECCDWGMKTTIQDIELLNPEEEEDFKWIYKIGDKVVKLTAESLMSDVKAEFATAQTKTVTYYN